MIVTVAVVDVSVRLVERVTRDGRVGGRAAHVRVGAVIPSPTTKFVPVTPIVNPADQRSGCQLTVTAVIVGPATIAIVPA